MATQIKKHRVVLPTSMKNELQFLKRDFKKYNGITGTIRKITEYVDGDEVVVEKGEPRGIFAAVKDGKTVHIGFSLCNKKDVFNREFGQYIAIKRALNAADKNIVPRSLDGHLTDFIERCRSYYKDAEHFSFNVQQ